MKARLSWTTVAVLLLGSAALVACPGCPSDPEGVIIQPATKKPMQFLLLMKDGKPFLLASVKEEVPHLRTLSPGAREEYLMRKAAVVVLEKALSDEKYAGQQVFVVNIVLPAGEDEYHRPRWGGAKEIAVLELERQRLSSLIAQSIEGLDAAALRGLFLSARFTPDGI